MKLRHGICAVLVCCSALWVVSSSPSSVRRAPPLPPGCDITLAIPQEVLSMSAGSGDINRRSLSPWTWRSTTVKNRIPATLWEAECSSSLCLSPNPGQTDGQSLNSVPIYQNVLVLQRQERGRCYTAAYQQVAVGCTCVSRTMTLI